LVGNISKGKFIHKLKDLLPADNLGQPATPGKMPVV
jgi:hypothetical protein